MTLTQHAPESKLNSYRFEGFSSPNSTAVPDEFFDVLAPELSEAELRVALYIIRRTFGFKKDSDAISLKQMVEGITTKEGRVLDRGTGMSRPGVTKGIRGLEAKGIIVTTHHSSKTRGYEATTYALRFRSDPIETTLRRGSQPRFEGHRNDVSIQETGEQQTEIQESFELSKGPPENDFVDNGVGNGVDNSPMLPIVVHVPPIANLMHDFSREMGDMDHVASNTTQAHRIYEQAGLELDEFFAIMYEARVRTRKTGGVQNRMAYFFTVLRDLALAERAGEG